VLTGLGAAPLGQLLPPSSQGQQAVSALPLWALGPSRLIPPLTNNTGANDSQQGISNQARVFLYNCTLVLPMSDYVALLAAALRGAAWKSGANATSAVLAGVTGFEPWPAAIPSLTRDSPHLILYSYTGWGVNGTMVRVTSDTPVPPCTDLPDLPLESGGPGCGTEQQHGGGGSGGSSRLAVGLGVGLGVSAGCVLATLIAASVWLLHRRKQAQ
jgi:hypothetical protein